MAENIPDSKSNAPSKLSISGDVFNPQNGIYEYYGFNIEPEAWGYPIDINKPLTQQLANTYILWRTKIYTRNKEILKGGQNNCSIYQTKERRGLQISKALEQTLSEESPKIWTKEDVNRQIKAFGIFNSRHRKATEGNQHESDKLHQQIEPKIKMKNMVVQMTY
ncbi:hypothetical protein HI914_02445 [Erysiphe necator]|nr:hypothetical protein HI914_02445 [Erysiphe necator]